MRCPNTASTVRVIPRASSRAGITTETSIGAVEP
jgi:hypothetical protein